jgi:serine/threonine-protein kinase
MAPEQARGKPVDRRADIWAFGGVLYEMLSGRPAFKGETITDVLAAVVTSEPDWSAMPASTPPRIRRLVARGLQKDPRSRLRDIGDARLELESADAESDVVATQVDGGRSLGRRRATMVAGTLGALALVLAAVVWSRPASSGIASAPPVHLSVMFAEDAQMHLGLPRPSLSLSPDGRTIVYTAAREPEPPRLWIRDLDRFEATPVPGTDGARLASFSPDGRWIAFFADSKLKKVPVTGGPSVVLCDAPGPFGLTWTSGDEIVFAQSYGAGASDVGLWRVPAAGGERRKVAGGLMWFPDALPGGKTVVVTLDNRSANTAGDLTVAAVDLASGQVTRLFDGGTYVRFSPSGHLIYLRSNQLYATPFDPETLSVSDVRMPIVSDVYFDPSVAGGNYALSAGTLAYVPGTAEQFQRTIMAAGAEGARPLMAERRVYGGPRLSPDGRRLALERRAWIDSVWTIEIDRGTSTRLTTSGRPSFGEPVWSRDGRRVFVGQAVDGVSNLFSVPSDGSGAEERLTTSPFVQLPHSVAKDDGTLVFTETHPETGNDLFALSLADGQARPLLATPFNETNAAISPDGRWMAWQSDRSGQFEIYVATFPGMDSPIQASGSGGHYPVWSPDGRTLYFNRRTFAATIEAVDVAPGASLNVSRSRIVGQYSMHDGVFDVMDDGRIVFTTGLGIDGSTQELRVVVNWQEELQRLVSTGR